MKSRDALCKASTGIHRTAFNISEGRIFGTAFGMPVAELATTGRKSGKERSTTLAVPITDGDELLVLVASFGGDDRHPAAMTVIQRGTSTSAPTRTGAT